MTLPVPLTFAESQTLRHAVEAAIANARDTFVSATVIRDANGVPLGGPDPRSVDAELAVVLARLTVRFDVDLVSVTAYERKLAALEAELAKCREAKIGMALGSVDGDPTGGYAGDLQSPPVAALQCQGFEADPTAKFRQSCTHCGYERYQHIR